MADVFPPDVQQTKSPSISQPQDTFNVPSSWLKPLTEALLAQSKSIKRKHAMGIDLTAIYPILLHNTLENGKTYHRLSHAIRFLAAGYDIILCNHPTCNAKAKILDHELKTIKSRKARKAYYASKEHHVVFLETSCDHGDWDREMVWIKRKVSFDDSVLVKTVDRWIKESDADYFDTAFVFGKKEIDPGADDAKTDFDAEWVGVGSDDLEDSVMSDGSDEITDTSKESEESDESRTSDDSMELDEGCSVNQYDWAY